MTDLIHRMAARARALFPRRTTARDTPPPPLTPPAASPYALWATAHGFDIVRRPAHHAEATR
ncbi:hypothetical protein AB8O64_15835 [Streptomyces sp. QH1-20]|uniref:hypothetical protein n=1 Tax=Streptomyces sp. QH1-20 TaxID=3240934 RepID=UPI003513D6C1